MAANKLLVRLCWLFTVVTFGGCAETRPKAKTSWQATEPGYKAGPPSSETEAFFPLIDGNLYHYRVELLGDRVEPAGMLMMKVHRKDAVRGTLKKPGADQSFEYTADGVATVTKTGAAAFLFKTPFAVDHSWLGPHGGVTRFSELGITINVASGNYAGCHRTREEVRGDVPRTVVTTLCPGVGIVQLRVDAAGGSEQAELVYNGPPIDIGPDGLTREQQ